MHPKSIDLSLSRIKRLLKDLNNPESKIQNSIQVVGTNGKHSVCSTLREIFETAGYSVNMNISPSLKKFNERYETDLLNEQKDLHTRYIASFADNALELKIYLYYNLTILN